MKSSLMRRGAAGRLVWCTWVIVFTVVATFAKGDAHADELISKQEIGVTQSQENNFPTDNIFSTTDAAESSTVAFADGNQEDPHPVNYEGAKVFTVRLVRKSQLKVIEELVKENLIDLWLDPKSSKRRRCDFMVMPSNLKRVQERLNGTNIKSVVMINDLQRLIDDENPVNMTIPSPDYHFRTGYKMNWDAYFKFDAISEFLEHSATTHPDICSLETIGKTVEGRGIKLIKISSGEDKKKPAIFIEGGAHAREWISPATVTYIVRELVENRADYETFVNDIDFHIVPLLNVDGYQYSHSRNRMWRKNRKIILGFCNGVDLNRNFGYKWGKSGSSTVNTCASNYAGREAFSEPESKAIKNYVSKFNVGYFQAYLSFHSYSQLILFPWGYTTALTPDSDDLQAVASNAANAIKNISQTNYKVGQTSRLLYTASGNSADWARAVGEMKYSYTIELPDKGRYGFALPAKYIKPTGKDAMEIIKAVADQLLAGKKKEDFSNKNK